MVLSMPLWKCRLRFLPQYDRGPTADSVLDGLVAVNCVCPKVETPSAQFSTERPFPEASSDYFSGTAVFLLRLCRTVTLALATAALSHRAVARGSQLFSLRGTAAVSVRPSGTAACVNSAGSAAVLAGHLAAHAAATVVPQYSRKQCRSRRCHGCRVPWQSSPSGTVASSRVASAGSAA